jgi:nucleoside-diphosphate-sugar epimerase
VDKTVVVTGVTSFLGLHVATAFAKAGYPVVGTCFTPPHKLDRLRGTRLAALKKSGVEIRILDICDVPAIRRLVLAERPGIWVQQAGIGRDFALPNYNSALANRINV